MGKMKRTISLRPKYYTNKKTQEKLDKTTVENNIKHIIGLLKTETQRILDNDGEAIKHLLSHETDPTTGHEWAKQGNMVGEQMGLNINTMGLRSPAMIRYMISDKVITDCRAWLARENIKNATTATYVSKGAKRTAWDTPPTAGLTLPLTAVNNNYATLTALNPSTIQLDFIVNDQWVSTEFNVPKKYQYGKIAKPSISITRDGALKFNFSVTSNRPLPRVSTDYVIGVDVGVRVPFAWSVVSTKTRQPVLSGDLPYDLKRLLASIQAIQDQIRHLNNKLEKTTHKLFVYERTFGELVDQRAALSRKRVEFAKKVGVFLADLSAEYDNATVVFEDLGHISNTMMFGRWFRGLVVKWSESIVGAQGGLVFKVNSAYSSRECSGCGEKEFYHFSNRDFVCESCGLVIDRDVNASVIIARRGISSVIKAAATRATKTDNSIVRPRPKPKKRRIIPTKIRRELFFKKFGSGLGQYDSAPHGLAGGGGNCSPLDPQGQPVIISISPHCRV